MKSNILDLTLQPSNDTMFGKISWQQRKPHGMPGNKCAESRLITGKFSDNLKGYEYIYIVFPVHVSTGYYILFMTFSM